MKKYNFEEIATLILKKCEGFGRIPSKSEILNDSDLPNPESIRKMFKRNTGESYIEFCKGFGFDIKSNNSILTFDDLCEIWENYYQSNGLYPTSLTCAKDKSLPAWSTVKKICGEKFIEFAEKFNLLKTVKTKTYDEYCTLFIEVSNKLGRPLKAQELNKSNEQNNFLPTYKWFVDNCPDKSVKNYKDFLYYLGYRLEPNPKYNFEELKKNLVLKCEQFGRILTKSEIINDPDLPDPCTLRKIFQRNMSQTYTAFCRSLGYKRLNNKSANQNLTYDDLCNLWEDYNQKYGSYPNSITCSKDKALPAWTTVKKVCGDRFLEFAEKYNLLRTVKTKTYEEYCILFIEESNKLGRPLKAEELNKNNQYSNLLPTYKWFIDNSPNKNVKTYNDFLYYLGYKPRYYIPKEYAIEAIFKKYNKLNKPLHYDDFRDPKDDEIGLSTIRMHWGTFNNMLKELGLPVNQESMIDKQKSIDELKEDIIRLCKHIYATEGRIVINQVSDINQCEWCLSRGTYNKYFNKYLGMTLGEFIKSIGFIPVESGRGMIYTFPDGEITTSKHEYEISTYLKENNVLYERNIRYRDFIPGYNGYKDCDYVINSSNDEVWYVEVAGILDYKKMKKENSIRKRYKRELEEKETMLKNNKLNYLIIYPHEIADYGLKSIFSPIINSR